jgi:hypothetical protein
MTTFADLDAQLEAVMVDHGRRRPTACYELFRYTDRLGRPGANYRDTPAYREWKRVRNNLQRRFDRLDQQVWNHPDNPYRNRSNG